MFAYKMNVENNIAYSLIFVTNDTKRYILTVSIFTKIIHLFEMSSLYEKENIPLISSLSTSYKKIKENCICLFHKCIYFCVIFKVFIIKYPHWCPK